MASRHDRRSKERLRRPVNSRSLRERFLVVCEGEKTEPNYFDAFRVPKDVKVVGTGYNTVVLVEEAIRLREGGDYDQVWCVFDRDSFPVDHFNQALQLAQSKGIKVAYSNECFELWYVLHCSYHQAATERHMYPALLSRLLGQPYSKSSPMIYGLLEDRMEVAIRNAERLHKNYIPHNPCRDNPCTTVYQLVRELRKSAV